MSPQPRRVVVLALNHRISVRVLNYARDLAHAGVDVHLVLSDERRAAEHEVDERVRVHALLPVEYRLPLRRAENLLLYRVPGKALSVADGLVRRSRVGKPLARPLDLARRGHRKVAGAVHQRAFMPFYRAVRPYLLSRRSRDLLRHVDVATADRIVAADISAVTLGWRLARRFPGPVATTALDRSPYIAPAADD